MRSGSLLPGYGLQGLNSGSIHWPLFICFIFEKRLYLGCSSVLQAGVELMAPFLSQSPKGGDYRCESLNRAPFVYY